MKKGFTLTELLVSVAVIGILAAMAVPSFKKYTRKSRQSEAKMSLASLYVAEKNAFAEFTTYASCLNVLGFDPGPAATRLYQVGVAVQTPDAEWGSKVVNRSMPCPYGGGLNVTEGMEYFTGSKFVAGYTGSVCASGLPDCINAICGLAVGFNCQVVWYDSFWAAASTTLEPAVLAAPWTVNLNGFTINQSKTIKEYNVYNWVVL
jgi:prepilin-type N-terminal cleavage/methylation domain-containing protein